MNALASPDVWAKRSPLALAEALMGQSRAAKRSLILLADSLLCVVATLLAFSLRVGALSFPPGPPLLFLAAALPCFIAVFHLAGVYDTIFRFAGAKTVFQLARASAIYALPLAVGFLWWSVAGVPRTVALLQPLLFFGLAATFRMALRHVLLEVVLPRNWAGGISRVLIYGAGHAGQQLALSLRHQPGFVLAGFVDDDPALRGQRIDGLPIFFRAELPQIVAWHAIDTVLLALPSASRARRRRLVESLQHLRLNVRTLPEIGELAGGKISVEDLREVRIEDLLGRDQVAPKVLLLAKTIVGKTVLVTGAGGSIGSELCRQIIAIGARKLILFDVSEFALYRIHQELAKAAAELRSGQIELVPVIGSVLDNVGLEDVFQAHRPETVFHAAAYKHVPLVEANPVAGMRNNVLGTYELARIVARSCVRDFTLVSTDKAVRPTNMMGASKRCAEMVIQAFATRSSHTRFSIVRFGNVLGSSGSVVPLFRRQIEAGGPITLTHKDVTRYFMTIPEAAQLVIQAGGMARGGEVFVLDMGQPMRIADLAETMVRLSGLTLRDSARPDGDIEIREIGLRPGEKLYEELLIGENPQPTDHPRIMKAHERALGAEAIVAVIERLRQCRNGEEIRRIFAEIEPGFAHCRDNMPLSKAS